MVVAMITLEPAGVLGTVAEGSVPIKSGSSPSSGTSDAIGRACGLAVPETLSSPFISRGKGKCEMMSPAAGNALDKTRAEARHCEGASLNDGIGRPQKARFENVGRQFRGRTRYRG